MLSERNRTLALIAVIGIALLTLFNANWLLQILGIIQSVVFITLGIVAIMYLWKRM